MPCNAIELQHSQAQGQLKAQAWPCDQKNKIMLERHGLGHVCEFYIYNLYRLDSRPCVGIVPVCVEAANDFLTVHDVAWVV
jgi:hypothetical protein